LANGPLKEPIPMKLNRIVAGLLTTLVLGCASSTLAQSVAVTATLDAATLAVGDSTTLHIVAQVLPNLRTNADRIFSWYVDVLNTNGTAVTANYGALQKTASDRDPQTSSSGVSQGNNRRGIYDTFLNRPFAGVSNGVELISIPVTASALGRTRFLVQAGSGVAGLSTDFLVAQKNGGLPLVGGDYSAAFVDLTVVGSVLCAPQLLAVPIGGGGPGQGFQLTFAPCSGRTHTVEFRNALGDVAGWQALPGAPHNSGTVSVTNSTTQRFFRVRVAP
jgi:hypothetical protein